MASLLVVDDSNLSRRISRSILESAGHSVSEASDGISAIEKYYIEKPELVLLDMTMHGMSGIDVLKKLRELDPKARIVIATADIQATTRILTAQAGAIGFVSKPLSADALLEAVNSALRGDS